MPRSPGSVVLGLVLAVAALPLGALSATAPDARAADAPEHHVAVSGSGVSTYPAYDASIDRYAVRTDATTQGALTVTATTSDPAGTVAVDGRPAPGGTATLTGLAAGDEVSVSITDAAGTTHQSFVVLPAGFPELTATGAGSPGDVLLTLTGPASPTAFEAVVDDHGVPVHVRAVAGAHDLEPSDAAPGHFTVAHLLPGDAGADGGWQVDELGARFEPLASYTLAADAATGVGPRDTDFRDAQLTADGRVVLVGRHRAVHADGRTWLDAVVQILDRSTGELLFTWDSKDAIDPADAYVLGARGEDYAHLDSVQLLDDGDLLVSLRNLGQVLRIATTTHDGHAPGDVVWRLGGRRGDVTVVDDPEGGFCAQHDARILPDGHLLLFDNGAQRDTAGPDTGQAMGQDADMCPDPQDPSGPRVARPRTRVVEYALDEEARTATLVWSHEVPGRYAASAGSAQRLGDPTTGPTLVGWGAARDLSGSTQPPLVSEVDHAGHETWSLTAPGWSSYRARRAPAPDASPPEIDVSGLADGASYALGSEITVDYTCTDTGGSNLRSCTGTVPSGSTWTVDGAPFTVTATDGAGHTTTEEIHYGAIVVETPQGSADVAIRRPGGHWIGVGRRGPRQVLVTGVPRGTARTAYVRVTNTFGTPQRMPVLAGPGDRGWRVVYRHRGTDVTARVTTSWPRFETPALPPGGHWVLRVDVHRRATSRAGRGLALPIGVDGGIFYTSDRVLLDVRAR